MKHLSSHCGSVFVDQVIVNYLARALSREKSQDGFSLSAGWQSLVEDLSTYETSLYQLVKEKLVMLKGEDLVKYYESYYINPEAGRRGKEKKKEARDDERSLKLMRRKTKNYSIYQFLSDEMATKLAPLIEMIRLEVHDFVSRITELAGLFGVVLTEKEIEVEYFKYSILALDGSIIQQLKYSTNLVFSLHMFSHLGDSIRQLNMPDHDPSFLGMKLWPRRLRVELNKLKSNRSWFKESSLQLVYTIFQGFKKGLWPMRPDGVFKNLEKHKKALSSNGAISGDLLKEVESVFGRHFPEFQPGNVALPPLVRENKISSRATIESSCLNGGSLGFLTKRFFNVKVKRELLPSPPVLLGFICEDEQDSGAYRWISPLPVYGADVPTRAELLIESQDHLNNREGKLEVQPSCIIEPMKIRIITKSSVGSYQGLRRIQKTIHSRMKRDTEFSLIGEPMDEETAKSIGTWWQPGSFYVSGDYSGATDNLKSEISDYLLQQILKGDRNGLFWKENSMFRKAIQGFTQTRVIYAKNTIPNYSGVCDYVRTGLLPEAFDQSNGQLMGNVLSFPILCLANYCCYVIALQRWLNRKLSRSEVRQNYPVKINGDDILFCNNMSFYSIWLKVVREFGFFPSPGKNFISEDFFQINSMLFKVVTGSRKSSEVSFKTSDDSHGGSLADYLDEGVPVWNCWDVKSEKSDDPYNYVVKEIKEIKYVNFGLALSRAKQDCSRDLSSVMCPTASHKVWVRIGEELDGLPPQLHRVANWPRIYSDYKTGLVSPLAERAKELWLKHQQHLLTFEGVHLPIRIPGIDFEDLPSTKDWEGRLIVKPTDRNLSLFKESKFDPLSWIGVTEFTVDDLNDCVRKIRRVNTLRKRAQLCTEQLKSVVDELQTLSPLSLSADESIDVIEPQFKPLRRLRIETTSC